MRYINWIIQANPIVLLILSQIFSFPSTSACTFKKKAKVEFSNEKMKQIQLLTFFSRFIVSPQFKIHRNCKKKSENRKVAWERMSRPIRSAWESKKRNIPQYWKKKFPEAKKTTKSNNLVQAAFNVFSDIALYESKLKRDCDFWRILQMNVRMHRVLER